MYSKPAPPPAAAPKPAAGAAAAAAKPKRKAPALPSHLFSAKRSLVLPTSLMQEFALIAAANTTANIETCGILCGKLESGTANQQSLRVTHCIIPVQHGTSDTCVTAGEEALIQVQDKYVHRPPPLTFLSSSLSLPLHFGVDLNGWIGVLLLQEQSAHVRLDSYPSLSVLLPVLH